jgi:glycosyltransferase involved in cell wall biosynthesis
MTKIGIVIPAWNSERFLSTTLEGVVTQSLADWECVVVDDGSMDGTADIVSQWCDRDSRIRLIRQENHGIAKARNRGYHELGSNTEYVIFLDHDDIWEKEALSTLSAVMDANPHAVGTHGLARYIDEGGVPIPPEKIIEAHRMNTALSVAPPDLEEWQRHRLGMRDGRIISLTLEHPTDFAHLVCECRTVTPGTVLLRRSAMAFKEPFDPDLVPLDAWDLWIRMSRRGDFLFVDKRILNYRFHQSNASKGFRGKTEPVLNRMYHKMYDSPENLKEHKRILTYWRRRHIRIQLRAAASHAMRSLQALQRGDIRMAKEKMDQSRYYFSECLSWLF